MGKWLRWVVESRPTWVRFLMSAETPATPQPFCVALSQSVHWHATFYFAALSIIFLLLGFRQWQYRADRVVNLNTTIWLPLFWRTWTGAQARTLPHVLIAIVEPRSWLTARSVASFIPDFSKIQKKQRPRKRLFQGSCPWLHVHIWFVTAD